MKKLSLLFVMLIAMTIGVKAQGHYIIPTVGYNFSNMAASDLNIKIGGINYHFDSSKNLEERAGFSAGLNYRYEFKNPFLIELGFYYNNYGYRMGKLYNNNNQIAAIQNYDYRVTHFSVPVMFGYKFVIGKNKVFSVTPKIGIQVGSYLHQYETYSFMIGNTSDYNYSEYEYDEKYNNGFDYAEMAAVEFAWKVGKILDIFVNVNNRFSFKDMIEDKDVSMYNYTFGAYLGLKVKVGE